MSNRYTQTPGSYPGSASLHRHLPDTKNELGVFINPFFIRVECVFSVRYPTPHQTSISSHLPPHGLLLCSTTVVHGLSGFMLLNPPCREKNGQTSIFSFPTSEIPSPSHPQFMKFPGSVIKTKIRFVCIALADDDYGDSPSHRHGSVSPSSYAKPDQADEVHPHPSWRTPSSIASHPTAPLLCAPTMVPLARVGTNEVALERNATSISSIFQSYSFTCE